MLQKSPTGIAGLDAITRGGLPTGRPTLVCGGPGSGKTCLAMEFLVRGATSFNEPGLFVSFEETPHDLAQNFHSTDFDVARLIDEQKLRIAHVPLAPGEILEAGEFSLDGLFIRLEQAIAAVDAKRVVLDTLEGLFACFTNADLLRSELVRLFHWLKDRGVTAIVTGERGAAELTRNGLEEYVSDCVLLLDHRISENIAKRRLRIIKYRGSGHGLDEYPFLVGERGLSVFPITSVALSDLASSEVATTGLEDLDAMLGRGGYYRGSSVLISGTAGAGKSTLAAAFANSTCQRGERCLYLAFEESESQILRNMRSVGIDLQPYVDSGLLRVQSLRPTLQGLEEHLVGMFRDIDSLAPAAVVIDPISNFLSVGASSEVKSMLVRVIDHLRAKGITNLATNLIPASSSAEYTGMEVSSLMDTWIVVENRFEDNRRIRRLRVVKSRGMDTSHDARQLVFSSQGLSLPPAPQRGPASDRLSSLEGRE